MHKIHAFKNKVISFQSHPQPKDHQTKTEQSMPLYHVIDQFFADRHVVGTQGNSAIGTNRFLFLPLLEAFMVVIVFAVDQNYIAFRHQTN